MIAIQGLALMLAVVLLVASIMGYRAVSAEPLDAECRHDMEQQPFGGELR